MQSSPLSSSQPTHPVQLQSLNHPHIGAIVPGLLFVILPSLLVIAVFLGKKSYRTYRANMLKQQIDLLEKIWHLNPNHVGYD